MRFPRLLFISQGGRWEVTVDLGQWLVGFNAFEGTWNVFVGCVRIGRNNDALAAKLASW